MKTRIFVAVAVGVAALVAATALAAERAERGKRRSGRPEPASAASERSKRETAVERARKEIRRDPSQRKFILFRYGLTDADVD